MPKIDEACPCGIGLPYADHCERIHRSGAGLEVSAEALMRSRYSAYVLHKRAFLLDSWHPETRPVSLEFDPELEWLGLQIISTDGGAAFDATGMVEFKARFRRRGEHLKLHERSSFLRLDGRWVYVLGE